MHKQWIVTEPNVDEVSELIKDNKRLRASIEDIECSLARYRVRLPELKAQTEASEQVAAAVAQCDQLEAQVDGERRLANLCGLHAAARALDTAFDRDQVLAIIGDVVVNLVGCERFSVFEVIADAPTLTLLTSMGIEHNASATSEVALRLRQVIESGAIHVAANPAGDDLRACFPLKVLDNVIAVVALFGLLPQKPGIEPFDREVFELLGSQAGRGLLCLAPMSAPINAPENGSAG